MTPSLTVEELRFRFPAGFSLGPVTLSLGPGVHWLRGPNGGGKTTLLRCLCGSLRPDSGTVHIMGRDPLRDHGARALVALLPAEPDLPGFLRVREAWRQAAALRGAPGWDGAPPMAALGLPPNLLLEHASRGQRRKAELLAALAGDPALLLLDEPYAGLDAESQAVLTRWLEGWRQERTVLLVSHASPPLEPCSQAEIRAGQPLRWVQGTSSLDTKLQAAGKGPVRSSA